VADEVSFTGASGAMWRFWTDKPLGAPGGSGRVYAAEGSDGRPMAVKVIPKQRPSGPIDERLLRREVQIGQRVRESGADMLLAVVDAAETSEALFLVMARADGALADLAMPLTEPQVTSVMTQIAVGLQQLHAIGIIHRDLKPANVLWHDGNWKLADFGIARDEEIGTQDPTFRGWGTWEYMAPELFELKSPTVKTDLYALGCVGFELLTGAAPYTGDLAAIRAGHLVENVPDIPCSNAALRNLIIRLLAKIPGGRPQDARAVLERLQRLPLSRSAVQEAIVRGFSEHIAEASQAAASRAAAEAEEKAFRDRIVQAQADLREIVHDAFEDLQAVASEATLEERQRTRPRGPDEWSSLSALPGFTLSTGGVRLGIYVWVHVPHRRVRFDWKQPVSVREDTLVRAGCVVISNSRSLGSLIAANLVYEQADGHFAWQVYRFHDPKNRPSPWREPDKYRGAPGGVHGLDSRDFFDSRRAHGIPAWSKTVAKLTGEELLELFREAVDLRYGPWQPWKLS
jgi:tRNA A-37 threonylcarbamoyl transferase component Bud32